MSKRKEREKAWLALLLAWIAGGVDAIGYLVLFHLFTAHMSGNSVAFGAHLAQHEWSEAWRRLFPIPLFMFGIATGAVLSDRAARKNARSVFRAALLAEAALLIAFMLCGNGVMRNGEIHTDAVWKFYALAALLPVAMGLQSATLRRIGGRTKVRTVFVTGMLTNFVEEAVTYLFQWREDTRERKAAGDDEQSQRTSRRQQSAQRAMLYGGIWLAYMGGAILSGFAEQRWALNALCFPLGGLMFIIARDFLRPISAKRRSINEVQKT